MSVNKKRYLGSNTFTEIKKMQSHDITAGDKFGHSVAASDTKIVVGAWSEDTGGSSAGAAYIYNIDGSQISKIQASDKATLNQFGWSVAASNNRIVVGARKAGTGGAVYIFDVNGTQLTKITASDAEADDQFGYAVAASDTNIIVGAPLEDTGASNAGSAYIFDMNGNELAKIQASDAAAYDNFGLSVGVTNTHVIVGAFLGSAAYVFDLKGNQLSIITASDGAGGWYGYSVDISSSRMVIGAPTVASSAGAAYVNRRYVNSYNEIPWAKIRLKFTGDAE